MYTRKLLALIMALALLAALMIMPAIGIADAGDFSGGSDFGGGSDWGGSSDWGSSDWGSSDWGSSDWDSDSSYSGGSGSFGGIGGIIAFIVIAYIVIRILGGKGGKGGKGGGGGSVAPGAAPTRMEHSIGELKAKDPNFDEEAMKEKIGNLYIKMQQQWQRKDWEPMRASMTDALYNQMQSGVEAKIRNKQTNYIERIAILGVELTGYREDENRQMLAALLRTRIVDYTLDDNSGALISGSRTDEKFMVYEWMFVRTKGAVTATQTKDESKTCPACGAPLDLNHTTKCPYCGTVITAKDYDWVLSGIKGISQRTNKVK